MGVTEDDTDLGRGSTLLGQLADLVNDLLGGGLEPRRGVAAVGDRRGGDTLSLGVKTAHFDGGLWCCRLESRGSVGRSLVGFEKGREKSSRSIAICLSGLPLGVDRVDCAGGRTSLN